MSQKYTLGLDVGISSVGWGMIGLNENNEPNKIIDLGVKIFSAAEVPKTGASKTEKRRNYRGTRRIIRRREFRVDRVRHLLNINGYLGEEIASGNVSETNEELEQIFIEMVNKYYTKKNTNPYNLKVEALNRKLTKDELSIILVHYAKHRGYKSNRADNSNENENGKVKEQIEENEQLMIEKKYRIASEMFIKDEKFKERIRNTTGNYNICITREAYLKEINLVLDKQIEYGLITEDFKNEFIEIWQSQRNYSKGPGGDSKYGGNLIERMTGKCRIDNQPRAPKCAPTSELFVAIQSLQNLRYKENQNDEYKKLNNEQIKEIIDQAKNQDTITYTKLFSIIGLKKGYIKGNYATNKEKEISIKKLLEKEKIKNFEYTNLTEEQKQKYEEIKLSEVNKRICITLKNYTIIRKKFIKNLGQQEWNSISNNIEMMDKIAEILTNYKLDEDIVNELHKNSEIKDIYYDTILELPNFKDHNMLSLDIMRKLIKLMLEGNTYDKSMELLGYDQSEFNINSEKQDLLIAINQDNAINNQRVIRALSQARGIINSVIKKYGMPERINVETARELSKSLTERNKISKQRDENYEKNQKIKKEIFENGLIESEENISGTDILKYKLWKEQNSKCAYSQEPIQPEILFDKNLVQIDHILPYSRTFDDSYSNKTLVLSKYNQEKGNKTPYEWIGKTGKWNEFCGYIQSLNIPENKKDNYILEKLTQEMEEEFRNQNLNDTKYISKYLVSYIKANLNVPKVGSPSGAITGKLRSYWNLNGLTHSIESDNYYKNGKDELPSKNRDNHLHHALDALLTAIANESVIKNVSDYEKYKRYIDNKTENELLEFAKNNEIEERDEYFNEEGELIATNITEYIKELLKNEYLEKRKNNTIRTVLPEPYKGFSEEAKIRVYEQNKVQMQFRLKDYNYPDKELESIQPIIPKFEKEKIGGSLHGETLYKYQDNNDGTFSKISRIDIADKKFNSDKLEKILEKDGGSKEVYNTIKEWLGNETGDKAFKKNDGYPINPKTGNKIKKIKIEENYSGKGHIINGNIVDKESIMKIEVYKSKKLEDESLYFVGLDTLDIHNQKKNPNIILDLWKSQTKHKIKTYDSIIKEYDKIISLNKNDLIEINTFNGKSCIGYTVGFSSGMFEIKSVLGDGYDLIGENRIFNDFRKQYQITISTIKSIRKIKINNLGKIE